MKNNIQIPPSSMQSNDFTTPSFGIFTPRVMFLLAFAAVMLLLPTLSHAASSPSGGGILPTTGVDIPGAADGDSWAKKFSFLIRLGIFIMCMAAVGFGMSDSIFGIFRTINDARNSGEWGPAIKQVIIILVGIVIALVLFGLLNTIVFGAIEKFF